MNDLRDEVAKAIWRAHCKAAEIRPGDEPDWQDFREEADAAILTVFSKLREPSDHMLDAGARAQAGPLGAPWDIWTDMLAAWRREMGL